MRDFGPGPVIDFWHSAPKCGGRILSRIKILICKRLIIYVYIKVLIMYTLRSITIDRDAMSAKRNVCVIDELADGLPIVCRPEPSVFIETSCHRRPILWFGACGLSQIGGGSPRS